MACAIGRFQPGLFSWGALTQKVSPLPECPRSSNIVTVRMAAHAGPRIELCVCRIIMIAIPTFLRSPRGFIGEWMREWFFVFGSPHVILLPVFCYYLRFPLFEP